MYYGQKFFKTNATAIALILEWLVMLTVSPGGRFCHTEWHGTGAPGWTCAPGAAVWEYLFGLCKILRWELQGYKQTQAEWIQAAKSKAVCKKIPSPCQPLFSLPLLINSVFDAGEGGRWALALLCKKSVSHAKYDVGRPADGVERCGRQGWTVHIYYSIWVLLNNKRVSHDDLKWALWHKASRCRNRRGTGNPSALLYPSGTII